MSREYGRRDLTGKQYTDEFRQDAVSLVTEQGYTISEAARSVGVSASLLGRWKQKLRGQEAFETSKRCAPEALPSLMEENRHIGTNEMTASTVIGDKATFALDMPPPKDSVIRDALGASKHSDADELQSLRRENRRLRTNQTTASTVNRDRVAFAPEMPPQDNVDLKVLFGTVWRQKWLVIAVAIVATALAAYFARGFAPEYAAEVLIMIGNRPAQIVDFESVVKGLSGDNTTVQSEIEVLRSRGLAGRVIDELQLNSDPEFKPSLREVDQSPGVLMGRLNTLLQWLGSLTQGTDEPEALTHQELSQQELLDQERTSIVDVFLKRLEVARKEETRVISVGFKSENPKTAALLANTLADFYVLGQREAKFEATRQANEWLNSKIVAVRKKVDASERAVEQFRQKSGLLGGGKGVTLISQQVSELNAELGRAATARVEAESRLSQITGLLNSGNIDSATEVLNSEIVQKLREQELEAVLGSEKQDARSRLMVEIDNIVKSVDNEAAVAGAREASLQGSLNVLKREVAEANTATVELRALEREAEANQQQLRSYLARFKKTSSQQDIELQQADARIISRADIPSRPLPSKKKLTMAVALAGSIFVGLLLVFLREHLQRGFRSSVQVEQATGVPVLGLVPMLGSFDRLRGSRKSHILRRPRSAFAESMRSLYTSLLVCDVDRPPNKILLVSAQPNESKTTIAVCLGRMQAAAGQKVIVVDADIRKPGIHRAFEMPRVPGLVGLLTDHASLEEVIQTDDASGAHVIPAGGSAPNPPSLLASDRMDAILDTLAESYDLVIVDSPPLMSVSDARILATKMDLTVFVLRWGRTEREVAKLALEQVATAGGHVAGVVLSMVDLKKNAQYGYGDSAFYSGGAKKYYA